MCTHAVLANDRVVYEDLAFHVRDTLGLGQVAAMNARAKGVIITSENYGFNTYPEGWMEVYALKRSLYRIDPIVTYGLTSSLPFDWETANKANPQEKFWQAAEEFQISRVGLSFPVHTHDGMVFILSVSMDESKDTEETWNEKKFELTKALHPIKDLLLEVCRKMLGVAPLTNARMLLTAAQRDALQAAVKGLTAKEFANQIGVSHAAVRDRREKLFQSLGVRSMTEAVALVLRSGQVDMDETPNRGDGD